MGVWKDIFGESKREVWARVAKELGGELQLGNWRVSDAVRAQLGGYDIVLDTYTVSTGNSSQTSDGAGALILASEAAVKRFGLQPLARFVSYASRGVPPHIMGIGPIEAIPAALRYAGLNQADIDWIELNEAFAAQSLAVMNSVGLDPAKVNPMGGAIALGHPLGATGAIRAATVVHALRRHNLKYGMVTMCVGTGQGAAGIFERV